MPSMSHALWHHQRAEQLDQLVAAHHMVGSQGRGRRHAVSQLNAAYATLLSSHFQGFCRDLHTEASQFVISSRVLA